MPISKSDFDRWWSDPVGVEFKNLLKENLDKLSHGSMTNAYARDHIGNAVEVGKYEATLFYLSLVYEHLTGEETRSIPKK